MSTAPECGDSSASELLAVFSGDPTSAKAMYARTFPRLRHLARRHAPSLPDDLHEDIVQETWLLVISRGVETFRAADVTGDVYLGMVLRNAVESVKSDSRPAGTPSRAKPDEDAAVVVNFDEAVEVDASKARFEVGCAEMEIRLDVALFADAAEPSVARALALMVNNGLSLTEAAVGVGMSRQTLTRRLIGLRSAA